MPAKKKTTKRKRTQAERDLQAALALTDQLAGDLQSVLAERDQARKELADARRGREAWCHKAIECEERADRAEEQLRTLLAGITAARPSEPRCHQCDNPTANGIHTCDRFLRGAAVPVHTPQAPPTTTLGVPGRFSREFRG